jgi:hypothetical protein
VREVVHFVGLGGAAEEHVEELEAEATQRWLDELSIPVPVSPDQLALPDLQQEPTP